MNYLSYSLLFIFGLAVGSFLNVVIFRYRPGGKLFSSRSIGWLGSSAERSRCLKCKKKLNWYELIPLFSFIFQKGKCRGCGVKISFQYFLVELLSALIFIFVPMYWAASLPLLLVPGYISIFITLSFFWILIFLAFIVLSAIDLKHFIIPDSINLFLVILGIILLVINNYYKRFSHTGGSFFGYYADLFGLRGNIWINYLFATVIVMIFFGLIIFLSRGKGMGWGDFKFVGALGLILGWPDIMGAVLLAFVAGCILSLTFIFFDKKRMKDIIPFGPFLAFGSCLIFFFGKQIMDLYFKLFGL